MIPGGGLTVLSLKMSASLAVNRFERSTVACSVSSALSDTRWSSSRRSSQETSVLFSTTRVKRYANTQRCAWAVSLWYWRDSVIADFR